MMQELILKYALRKAGAYVDYPFGADVTVVKVRAGSQDKGRIFVQLFELKGEKKATFNCTYDGGLHYRTLYFGKVVRGYHCPLVQQPYFNTVTLDDSIDIDVMLEMVDHAYEAVVAKFPKYVQRELESL